MAFFSIFLIEKNPSTNTSIFYVTTESEHKIFARYFTSILWLNFQQVLLDID